MHQARRVRGGWDSDWFSPPRCCYVRGWGTYNWGIAIIYQGVQPVKNCTSKVYHEGSVFASVQGGANDWAMAEINILVRVNGQWMKEWGRSVWQVGPGQQGEGDTVWTKWEKVFGPNDTIQGIMFRADFGASYDALGVARILIDDVYISGEVGG